MAKGYRPVRRDQPFLLPPDMREWLPADHAVWLVIRAVERHLDTSVLHARRRTGGAGTAGYDPDMLLAVLVWGYACGVTSSRRLEELCWRDVTFRVICGGDVPDHVTIARFRADFPAVIGELFAQVLVLCARLGMGELGTVALDGTKIKANAAMKANRSEEHLRKLAGEAVARHADADAAEDAVSGAGRRRDRVPPGGSAGGSRDERIAAALAGLAADRQAAEQAQNAVRRTHTDAAAAGTPVRGRPPAGAETQLAQTRVARIEAAQQAKIADWERRNAERTAAGQPRLKGSRPKPLAECGRVRAARATLAQAEATRARRQHDPPKTPVRNITDPDSRLMTTAAGGFVQGYNAQNVTSADGLIIATELTSDANDTGWFEPMLRAAEDAARLITRHQPARGGDHCDGQDQEKLIGLVLADAGYLTEHNLTITGPDRLIATGKHRDLEKAAADPEPDGHDDPGHDDDGPIAAMTARLRTPDGITAYRQRGHIAETPHGYIKHTMGFRQLCLRGHPNAAAEWTFAAAVHNLFKAITSGHATLATLPA